MLGRCGQFQCEYLLGSYGQFQCKYWLSVRTEGAGRYMVQRRTAYASSIGSGASCGHDATRADLPTVRAAKRACKGLAFEAAASEEAKAAALQELFRVERRQLQRLRKMGLTA